ncbi:MULTISPECIES: ABC transporter ATP-binding protein [unclassified Schlesneria]|uniref:ABC transporter ATP-binding protein n=1 Tax=Schlesneria TaxID=656899 RepID=UPI002EE05417
MIELIDVTIRSGPFQLSHVNLTVESGRYGILMGGTGQGKTTLLEAICGLRQVTAGKVVICGDEMTKWKSANRGIGYVPQDLALFPTMTVREHLEFALRIRRMDPVTIRQRVHDLSEVLGIKGLLDRRTQHLSGGEGQRVALGRALAFQPQVLLLDEPLNALDEQTRNRLCDLLRSLQRERQLTVLHITHSRAEAVALADQLFVMEANQITERPLSNLTGPGPVAADRPEGGSQ